MNTEQLYVLLDGDASADVKHKSLTVYLKCTNKLSPANDQDKQQIAHCIADLTSTNYVQLLDENNLISVIMTLAEELEVIDENYASNWQGMMQLIDQL